MFAKTKHELLCVQDVDNIWSTYDYAVAADVSAFQQKCMRKQKNLVPWGGGIRQCYALKRNRGSTIILLPTLQIIFNLSISSCTLHHQRRRSINSGIRHRVVFYLHENFKLNMTLKNLKLTELFGSCILNKVEIMFILPTVVSSFKYCGSQSEFSICPNCKRVGLKVDFDKIFNRTQNVVDSIYSVISSGVIANDFL